MEDLDILAGDEAGVHGVWLDPQGLIDALHEVGVAILEQDGRQDPRHQLLFHGPASRATATSVLVLRRGVACLGM